MTFLENDIYSYSMVDRREAIQQEALMVGEYIFEWLARERNITVEKNTMLMCDKVAQEKGSLPTLF